MKTFSFHTRHIAELALKMYLQAGWKGAITPVGEYFEVQVHETLRSFAGHDLTATASRLRGMK